MEDFVSHRQKCQGKRHLRKMVRSLVSNLERFQDELLTVLDDMKSLVGQIDIVSSKLDNTFGNKWEETIEDIPRSNSSVKVCDSHPEHLYVNIDLRPKIQQIEEKINFKLCSKVENNNNETVSQHICPKVNRPNSFEKGLEKTNSANKFKDSNDEKTEQHLESVESPMLDLSYLGINQADNMPRWGRSISLPTGVRSCKGPPSRSPEIQATNDSQQIFERLCTPTARCFAELKRHYVTKNSSNSCTSDDVFNNKDIKTSSLATGTTVKSITSSSMISNVSVDGDMYERKLEDELEHTLDSSDASITTEYSDDNMETGSNSRTASYSDNVEGRYDVNLWTPLTLNYMSGSSRSSDSFVSDTPSDIINDNIWPPSNVGNIFSNSMLARKLSKHLDNDFCSLTDEVEH